MEPDQAQKGGRRIRPFCGPPLRIDLFLSDSNKGRFLITLFDFISRKVTLSIFVPGAPHTVGSQADICENILCHNLTVCVDTYICDLSFPKIAVLKVL